MLTLEQRVERIEKHLRLVPEEEPPTVLTLPRVAIVVGHSRIGDRGARSATGVAEHEYNTQVARQLANLFYLEDQRCVLIESIPESSYVAAMRWVANEIRTLNCDIALELHFNASGTHTARGHEYLYWHSSSDGKRLATCLISTQDEFDSRYSRGTKPKGPGDRGAHFLSKTHCPAVICEPFFGDNPDDWTKWGSSKETLAQIYYNAILKYYNVSS